MFFASQFRLSSLGNLDKYRTVCHRGNSTLRCHSTAICALAQWSTEVLVVNTDVRCEILQSCTLKCYNFTSKELPEFNTRIALSGNLLAKFVCTRWIFAYRFRRRLVSHLSLHFLPCFVFYTVLWCGIARGGGDSSPYVHGPINIYLTRFRS